MTALWGLHRFQHLNITQTSPLGLKCTTPKKKPPSPIKNHVSSVLPTKRIYNAPLTFSKNSKSPPQIQRWSVIQIKPMQQGWLVLRGQALQCHQGHHQGLPKPGSGPGASFPGDCTPSHWARLEREVGRWGGGEENAGCGEEGSKGVGGKILVTASKGHNGRERAQDGAGIRASPYYQLCSPEHISQPLWASGISSVNSDETPVTPNLPRQLWEVNKIWKQLDNYQARWVVIVMRGEGCSEVFPCNSIVFF